VLTAGSVDPFNPKVVRSSAGALFEVPVVVDVQMDDVLRRASPRLRAVGTTSHDQPGVRPYTSVDLTVPTLVIVGNESSGLDPSLAVDEWISVPHAGRAESLNVAMAATVVVFEVLRQRQGR
jgi:TrmH family RNA methyltransferase